MNFSNVKNNLKNIDKNVNDSFSFKRERIVAHNKQHGNQESKKNSIFFNFSLHIYYQHYS